MIQVLLAASGGYLLGSIPFGFLLARLAGLGDIRSVGSGNIGATNVLRTGRKDIAALTLVLDLAKGAAAVLLAGLVGDPLLPLVAGVAAVLGHCTTIWMGGRGGKGGATGLGVTLALAWPVALAVAAIWLAVAVFTRLSSAATLAGCLAGPILLLVFRGPGVALAAALISLIIVVRHEGNIRRLLAGTEPRIGAKT